MVEAGPILRSGRNRSRGLVLNIQRWWAVVCPMSVQHLSGCYYWSGVVLGWRP